MSDFFKIFLKQLRPMHWPKNLLIFLPCFARTSVLQSNQFYISIFVFIGMCLAASSGYLLNDLFDQKSDKQSAQKKKRPYASGQFTKGHILIWTPVLAVAGLGLAAQVSVEMFFLILGYLIVSYVYSIKLKKIFGLDVVLVSLFFVFRVILGCKIFDVSIELLPLLSLFFFFLGLALVKRRVEISAENAVERDPVSRRPYGAKNAGALNKLANIFGFMAMVLASYFLLEADISSRFSRHWVLFLLIPVSAFWHKRIWKMASEGKLSDDLFSFLIRDRVTYFYGALTFSLFFLSL